MPPESMPDLTAALLKQCRTLADWSQRKLADQAGVHEQTVKYWEGKQGVIAGIAVDRMFKELAVTLANKSSNQRCGAQTRKGPPCRAKALPGKTRCKFHGGMSTGPKTAEGRQRIAEAQRRRWAAYRKAA